MANRQLYAKIIDLAGTTIARLSPNYQGESGPIEYTEVASINGEDVIGQCTVNLEKVTAPEFHFQRDIQRAIKKQHRIEIYSTPTFRGVPEWSGVIVSNPSDGSMRLDCEDASRRLKQRNTRRDEVLNGNAATVAQGLLGVHKTIVLSDDFNRTTGLGADWTVTGAAEYSIVSNQVKRSTNTGVSYLQTTASQSAAFWNDCLIMFDVNLTGYAVGASTPLFVATFVDNGVNDRMDVSVSNPSYTSGFYSFAVGDGGAFSESRDYAFPADAWLHFEVYLSMPTSATRRVIVVVNNIEMIDVTNTSVVVTSHAGKTTFDLESSVTYPQYLDNVLLLQKANALTVGTFDTTTETLTDQETSGMSQRDALNWIANRLGREWRVNPQAGEGNDTVDFKASVGYDWTATKVLFKETEDKDYPFRIIRCQRNDASEELATVLRTYGQRNDDAAGSFISVDLDAIAIYGIIEGQHSDERIIDVATAKVIGDIELAKRSGNTPSYSFTLVDETKLYEQDPVWGYAMWGDFIWGGRTKLRAGDTISVSSESLDLFKEPLKILSLRRQSGTNEVEVTCEFRPWTRQRARQRLEDQLQRAIREAYLKMDTQTLDFALSGTTAQTQSFSIQGNYRSVRIDIHSASWGGAGVAITLDGVDRTARWFGIGSVTANATAREKVMVFLYASLAPGVHTLTLTPTATVTVRVDIRPQVRS